MAEENSGCGNVVCCIGIIIFIAILKSFSGGGSTDDTYSESYEPLGNITELENSKKYSDDYISFEFPKNWVSGTVTEYYTLVELENPNSNIDGEALTNVVISRWADKTLSSAREDTLSGLSDLEGYEIISENKIDIDGVSADEYVIKGSYDGYDLKFRIIILENNGVVYTITSSFKASDYESQQEDFEIILDTFSFK